MGIASAIINLLAALFGAVPSIKELVQSALELADKANSAEAALRKANKDKAVDDEIDGNSGGNNDGGNAS